MKHARLDKSERLQRALRALQQHGGWMTTRQLIRTASICAVNSVIAELRANGATIECRRQDSHSGGRRRVRWSYRLVTAPEGWA